MKTYFFITLFLVTCVCNIFAQNTDLPSPTANLQTLPAGSYVIAMDNTNQLNNSAVFNYKSYGLVVTLLNSSKKVKWVITAGKAKDGIDFTVNASRIKPTAGAAASYSFKAGPFVIFAEDTTGVAAVIDAFNSSISNANDKIKVYKTNASVTVDIRYDLTGFIPKGAVLDDGANVNIHLTYMTVCNVPSSNYHVAMGQDLLTDCYTFASEPHNSKTGASIDASILAIKAFVQYGGNFLAQCYAVINYENNALGRFQTTTGITDANSTAGTAISYPNPDLSFSQFEGSYSISIGGSLQNWRINAAGTNNFHKHAKVNADTTVIGASVSKLKTGSGGLVFYIGNHNFNSYNSVPAVNGLRMYMNAFLTPVTIAGNCTIATPYMYPLALKLIAFRGNLQNETARLSWEVSENEKIKEFVVERSSNGNNFTSSAPISSYSNTGPATYYYTEPMPADIVFYRLKIIDKSGEVTYSSILVFQQNNKTDPGLKILSNAEQDLLTLGFESSDDQNKTIRVTDMAGRQVIVEKINSMKGNNLVTISLPPALGKGMYVVDLFNGMQHRSAKFVRN